METFHNYSRLSLDLQYRILSNSIELVRIARTLNTTLRRMSKHQKFEADLLSPPSHGELLAYSTTLPSTIAFFTHQSNDDGDLIFRAEIYRRLNGGYFYEQGTIYDGAFVDDDGGCQEFDDYIDNIYNDSSEIFYDLMTIRFICHTRVLIFGIEKPEEIETIIKDSVIKYLKCLVDHLSGEELPKQFLYLYKNAKLLLIRTTEETLFIEKYVEFQLHDQFQPNNGIDLEKIESMCKRLYSNIIKRLEFVEW